jgi:hypothetical protein
LLIQPTVLAISGYFLGHFFGRNRDDCSC